jgi:hypothetical protein
MTAARTQSPCLPTGSHPAGTVRVVPSNLWFTREMVLFPSLALLLPAVPTVAVKLHIKAG